MPESWQKTVMKHVNLRKEDITDAFVEKITRVKNGLQRRGNKDYVSSMYFDELGLPIDLDAISCHNTWEPMWLTDCQTIIIMTTTIIIHDHH